MEKAGSLSIPGSAVQKHVRRRLGDMNVAAWADVEELGMDHLESSNPGC